MRVLTLALAVALASGCASDFGDPPEHALRHPTPDATDMRKDPESAESLRLFSGVVGALNSETRNGALQTCATITGIDGAPSSPICYPGGVDGQRARRVSGFPWLASGERVQLHARRLSGEWRVVQGSVVRPTNLAASAQAGGVAR